MVTGSSIWFRAVYSMVSVKDPELMKLKVHTIRRTIIEAKLYNKTIEGESPPQFEVRTHIVIPPACILKRMRWLIILSVLDACEHRVSQVSLCSLVASCIHAYLLKPLRVRISTNTREPVITASETMLKTSHVWIMTASTETLVPRNAPIHLKTWMGSNNQCWVPSMKRGTTHRIMVVAGDVRWM